jgi:hypothetical protein
MIHRRSLIAAAASAPLAGLAGSFAQATPVDPHPVWLRQWRILRDEWQLSEEGSQQASDLWESTVAIEKRLSSRAAQTTRGALAQIEWMLADSLGMDFQVGHREALELAVQSLTASVDAVPA